MSQPRAIQDRVKALAKQRDEALEQARELKLEMARMADEMSHLRHLKAGVERLARNIGVGK